MRILLISMLLSAAVCPARTPSSYTAEWILVNAPTVQGREHSVRVAYVKFANRGSGRVEFVAQTHDDGEWGGRVRLVVPEAKSNEIQRRFGSELDWKNNSGVKTRRFDGVVHVDHETNTVFLVDREAWESMQADLKSSIRAEIRNWTSNDGATIQAGLVRATSDSATILRHPDRTEFTIPLSRLSKDDQDYVKQWLTDAAGGGSSTK